MLNIQNIVLIEMISIILMFLPHPPREIEYVKSQIADGKLVIIDLRNILSEDTRVMHSQFLTGLGVSSPIIVSGIYRGELVVNMISSEVTDQNNQSIDIPEAENYSLEQSLKHVLKRFDFQS